MIDATSSIEIATNFSERKFYSTGELTPLPEVWSDKYSYPMGTIRRFVDQSPLLHDFGQDDHTRQAIFRIVLMDNLVPEEE